MARVGGEQAAQGRYGREKTAQQQIVKGVESRTVGWVEEGYWSGIRGGQRT